jgi:uncharacterized protein YwgA
MKQTPIGEHMKWVEEQIKQALEMSDKFHDMEINKYREVIDKMRERAEKLVEALELVVDRAKVYEVDEWSTDYVIRNSQYVQCPILNAIQALKEWRGE